MKFIGSSRVKYEFLHLEEFSSRSLCNLTQLLPVARPEKYLTVKTKLNDKEAAESWFRNNNSTRSSQESSILSFSQS